MSAADLARFREVVLADGALLDHLLAEPDRRAAAARIVEAAGARGFEVTAADVDDAVRDARRAWLERWV